MKYENDIPVRHVRTVIAISHDEAKRVRSADVLPGEYEIAGYNFDRRVCIVLAVSKSVGGPAEAVHAADAWVTRAGKVRPNTWITREK